MRHVLSCGLFLALLSGAAGAEEPLDCVDQPDSAAIGFTTICAGQETFEASQLQGWTCDQLWNLRNNILYTEGYCFTSARAKAAFDNTGCSVHSLAEVPLNEHQKANIKLVESLEQQQSCPTD